MTAADRAYRPQQGLEAYFSGPWSYLRLLDDRRLGAQGSLLGICRFSPQGDGLIYSERGRLSFAGVETAATRCYRYSFPADLRAQVSFIDGRAFHGLDLSTGKDSFSHHCPPDLYEGRCRLSDDNVWHLEWRVSGPRKDLRLTTCYRRFADPLRCFSPDGPKPA